MSIYIVPREERSALQKMKQRQNKEQKLWKRNYGNKRIFSCHFNLGKDCDV